ncbi:alpha/beta fold hydrolase [Idiomarina aminovorans]|uniref:alpha/beta fold hydrolase n=1 Tax=Idiomarina aminovorans TaxID=2914829 RepID=UPI002003CD7B|nr:alpha/beta hydrolase [Idiomarina sp. ATCH4]MCK7460455.1 alpha/beta hydrolase [Idiomarina sp. ATCH4]
MSELEAGIHLYGEQQNTPVILLHSSQSASTQWRALVKNLISSHFVIAVDLLGYGQAPKVEFAANFRLEQELPRIISAVEHLGLSQPVQLVGHSYGGAVALKLALENPFKIADVVLYEPVAFHALPDDSPGMLEIQEISQAMHGRDAIECTRTFVDYWNNAGYFDALPERIQQLMVSQADKVALDFDALLNEPRRLNDYSGVDQHVLLLQGEHTRRSAKAVAEALSTVLPDLERAFVAAGHMGPLTHSADVNERILRFLRNSP